MVKHNFWSVKGYLKVEVGNFRIDPKLPNMVKYTNAIISGTITGKSCARF